MSVVQAQAVYNLKVPREYGGVILIGAASAIVLSWQSLAVSVMRKKRNVPYPTMYTDDVLFNCYQRAHQNTLETYPQFLAFLLLSGIHAPKMSIAAGTSWLIGRIVYACGYHTGAVPSRFAPGAVISNVSQVFLLGGAVHTGLRFLKVC